jgi:hypothetical protein
VNKGKAKEERALLFAGERLLCCCLSGKAPLCSTFEFVTLEMASSFFLLSLVV